MKFIVCPFCKVRITTDAFPRRRREEGHVVMLCPGCKHRLAFTIRDTEQNQERDRFRDKNLSTNKVKLSLQVVENVFGYAEIFQLSEGLNRVGRYNNKYSELEVPIHTADPSMDRTHCLILVDANNPEKINATIMDNDSMTGTFINSRELEPEEKYILKDGDVITLGATTLLYLEK